MIEITSSIHIPERELAFHFIRSAGPGGQNVNKVSTAVQLRFDVHNSSLPGDVKVRLTKLAGNRMTLEGVLVIEAKALRTQEKNREDAIVRLVTLVRRAAERPKVRRKTKPTRTAKEARLKAKRKRSEVKRERNRKAFDG